MDVCCRMMRCERPDDQTRIARIFYIPKTSQKETLASKQPLSLQINEPIEFATPLQPAANICMTRTLRKLCIYVHTEYAGKKTDAEIFCKRFAGVEKRIHL